ncbi:MAG: hypothetical protein AABW90_00010 [Nanoarchaeota archaeon]
MKLKKELKVFLIFLLAILFLFMLPSISAIEITFSKDSYQPQETLQAKITGNFISLISDNIFIYKDGKAHPEPVIKDLTKQNNIYYFYAILPKQPGNYSFRIQDTSYLERGEINPDTIIKPIKVEFKNTSDLSFNPGFIIPNKDFSVKVKSLYGNTPLTAKFETTGETKNLSLIEQVEETIKFKLPELLPQQSKIIINGYEIPVFLIKKINETRELKLEFIPYILEGTITIEAKYYFTVIIRNTGNKKIENLTLSSNLDAIINPKNIGLLEPNKTRVINLTISVSKTEGKKLEGQIKAESSETVFYLPVFFNVTTNKSEVKIKDAKKESSLNCSQIGILCEESEICNGETVSSLEGPCCIGSCIEQKKSNLSKIIGIILLIILFLIIIYIIWKIRKRQKLKSPEEILREKSERFKKRTEPSEEVAGRLDRV